MNIFFSVIQVELALNELVRLLEETKEEAEKDIDRINMAAIAGECSPKDAKECLELIDLLVNYLGVIEEERVRSTQELLQLIAAQKA